jgi:small-conductance mechanosensitive channel
VSTRGRPATRGPALVARAAGEPARGVRRTLAGLAFALLPLLAGAAAGADQRATEPVQQHAEQAARRASGPFGADEILARAEADQRFLREVMAIARQPDPTERLVAPLQEIDDGIRTLAANFTPHELRSLPPFGLESLDRYWSFYDARLGGWRNELQRITDRYTEASAGLARRKAAWEATLAAASAGALPHALGERVRAILGEIVQAEQALAAPLGDQVRLAIRADGVREGIAAGRRALDSESEELEHRMHRIDSPALSRLWADRASVDAGFSRLASVMRIQHTFVVQYLRTYAARHVVLALAALAALALLLGASRRSLAGSTQSSNQSAPSLFLRRPIASWMLLLLLLGVVYFDSDAPTTLLAAALILALIPVLRLLPRGVSEALGGWPYVLTAVYLLHQLRFLVVGAPLPQRLHLLATGILMLGSLLWLLARLRRTNGSFGTPARWAAVRLVVGLMAVALAAGLVSDVVGNVVLAQSMVGGVVTGAYAALVLFVATALVDAILALLLQRHAGSEFPAATRHAAPLVQILGRLARLAALAAWIVVLLKNFYVYRPVADWLAGVLKRPLGYGQVAVTLGGVLLFVVSVLVSFWLAKTIRAVLQDEVLPNIELPHGVGNSISTLTYYTVVTIGLLFALVAAGFELSDVSLVVGALGVGIGFGLQNVVNNFVSGLILMFERPIQPGDLIEVAGMTGKVQDIGLRATRVRTGEGADVVVPNSALVSEKLINWSLSDRSRRFDVDVRVAYGSDPQRVIELLIEAARTTPGVSASPEVSALFVGTGQRSLDFQIRAWTDDLNRWTALRSDVTLRAYAALAAAGVDFPAPM